MVYDLRNPLTATWWQPAEGSLGDLVADLDDINQCVLTILSTPQGCDPHRPDFAVDLLSYLDRPITLIRPRLVRDVIAALTKFERRIKIIKVVVSITDLSTLTLSVYWQLSGQVNASDAYQTTVSVPVGTTSIVASPFAAIPYVVGSTPGLIDGGTS